MIDSEKRSVYGLYFRDKLITQEQIKILKEVGLEILKVFHKICEKADIKYSLALKTLLGAVKYHGFLPEDDLIRVFIKESDYERLRDVVLRDYPSEYVLMDRDMDKIYTSPNPRLVKLNTLIVKASGDSRPDGLGVYIDIYLLRDAPEKNRAFVESAYKKYLEVAYQVCDFKYPSKIIRERAEIYPQLKEYYNKRRSIGFFASLLPIRFWTWCRERAIKGKENSKDYLLCGRGLKYIDKSVCKEYELCEFEGEQFYIFKEYDKLFKYIYGDFVPVEINDLERLKVLLQLEK